MLHFLKNLSIMFCAFGFIYFFIEVFCKYAYNGKGKEFLKLLIMMLFGGISGICVFLMYCFLKTHISFIFLMLFGGIIITALEFFGGLLLNKKFKLAIWNYSNSKIKIFGKEIPINLFGQIDVYHSLGWFLLCWPLFLLGEYLL